MARIRTIKPDMGESRDIAKLSFAARYFFCILLTQLDDEGRAEWLPKKLAGMMYAHDENVGPEQMNEWLDECIRASVMVKYVAEGSVWIAAPSFGKHQTINRKSAVHSPPIPENCNNTHALLTESSVSPHTMEKEREKEMEVGKGKNPPISPQGDRGKRDFAQGVEVPQQLESIQGFSEAWEARKEQRQSTPKTRYPTEASVRAELKLLESCRDPVAVLNRAVASGWQGLNIQDRDRKGFQPPTRNGQIDDGGRFLN